jgi:hypothetical protein
MGRAGRERYLKLFSPDPVLLMLLDTYRRLAGGRALVASAGDGCASVWAKDSGGVEAPVSVN